MIPLPIDAVIPELKATLRAGTACVLEAPPGAGKTTRLPLALLHEPWLAGQGIVMLEPRRLAAGAAARQMARLLGENVGDTVGYRIRFESKVSAKTRIEVVTEGILTRRLQQDPELTGVGLVIFDEFHERSLNTDLALALTLEAQAALREDLRILVMSATLDAAPVATLLGNAPLLTSEGRSYPVDVRYLAREPESRTPLGVTMHAGIRQALREEPGNILCFLPGAGEIRNVAERLAQDGDADTVIAPLYGDLSPEAQATALEEAPAGLRKIVLATSIAETSLTIPGIRIVIDSGYGRAPLFDPVSGMTRLETQRVSQASATQRAGRAGRLMPGIAYRLWSEGIQAGLKKQNTPEILSADLAPLLLELAAWGVSDVTSLTWLDTPPAAAIAQAGELLQELDALDDKGRLTAHGRAINELALHPRLAHMILRAHALGFGDVACLLAGLLGERDILRGRERTVDVALRLHALRALEAKRETPPELDKAGARRALEAAKQFRRRLGITAQPQADEDAWLGVLLAFAYPDRIAQLRPGSRARYVLSGGRGAQLEEADGLAASDYLALAELDGQAREAKVFMAAALAKNDLFTHFSAQITELERTQWSAKDEAVIARREWRLGELLLKSEALKNVPMETIGRGLCDGIRQKGLAILPWSEAARAWQARLNFLYQELGAPWPDLGDDALLGSLEQWLLPYLNGMSRIAHLAQLDLLAALNSLLPWELKSKLEEWAPSHLLVPTGNRIRLDYAVDGPPVLAVRLQELFGQAQTPKLAGGKVAVRLHLLSPGHKPVAVTDDLARFWTVGYPDVKKDMKGRYPKHYWPENPLQAEPTARAKPRGT